MTDIDPQKTAMQIATGLAKDVYVDGLQPPVKVIGEALEGILKAITYYPRYWGQVSDISIEDKKARFEKKLREKVETIPEENKMLPPPNILGPSVQALEYGIYDDYLSDMFSSLIANSMDTRKYLESHPSFVEIIKQLTADEAKVIKYLGGFSQEVFPILNINVKVSEAGGYNPLVKKFHKICDLAECWDISKYKEIIDNLDRLKMIDLDLSASSSQVEDKGEYESLFLVLEEKYGISITRQENAINLPDFPIGGHSYELGLFSISAFGLQFYKACVK